MRFSRYEPAPPRHRRFGDDATASVKKLLSPDWEPIQLPLNWKLRQLGTLCLMLTLGFITERALLKLLETSVSVNTGAVTDSEIQGFYGRCIEIGSHRRHPILAAR